MNNVTHVCVDVTTADQQRAGNIAAHRTATTWTSWRGISRIYGPAGVLKNRSTSTRPALSGPLVRISRSSSPSLTAARLHRGCSSTTCGVSAPRSLRAMECNATAHAAVPPTGATPKRGRRQLWRRAPEASAASCLSDQPSAGSDRLVPKADHLAGPSPLIFFSAGRSRREQQLPRRGRGGTHGSGDSAAARAQKRYLGEAALRRTSPDSSARSCGTDLHRSESLALIQL